MQQNSRAVRVTIVTCGGVAAIAAIFIWLVRSVPTPASPQPPRSVAQPAKAEAPIAAAKVTAVGSAANTSDTIDYKKAFAEAQNYWDYATVCCPPPRRAIPTLSSISPECWNVVMKTTECTFSAEGKKLD